MPNHRINQRKYKLYKSIRRKTTIVVFLVVLEFLMFFSIAGYRLYKHAQSEISVMKQYATVLKDEAKLILEDVKTFNVDAAEEKIVVIKDTEQNIRDRLRKPLWRIAAFMPFTKNIMKSVVTALDALDEAVDSLILPLFQVVRENPIDQFKVGEGFNAKIIRSYILYAEYAEPIALDLFEKVSTINLSIIDKDGKIKKYQEKALEYYDLFKGFKTDIAVVKTLIGSEDRYYMFAAQNSSEIRAAGGFVGSVGTIRIKDGILYVGDFQTVYNTMKVYTPSSGNVTSQEKTLFGNRLILARDSEYNPDFRRVAEIWASAYEPYNKVKVDGVISMTPVLVQKLLKVTGGSIKLSDGTVLNGDNATKAIEYDIYHRYFNVDTYDSESNEKSDKLFEEAAKKAVKEFTSNFKVKQIMDYYKIYKESTQDRTLMMWMKDPDEEQILIDAGVSGVLNTGKNNAVAGVYFSNTIASKLGIFTNINCSSKFVKRNEDGTAVYSVTVDLRNTLTNKELKNDSIYILGTNNGVMSCYVHLFAPVGGTISDIVSSDGKNYKIDNYLGLDVGYSLSVTLRPGRTITITYTITIAAGVDEPLSFSVTPTLQDYL